MRVVVGLQAFGPTGGTESYVFTVSRELQRLGHETIIAADELGPMADFAESHGLAVARTPADLPQHCDTVFAHDAIMGATLAERYPDARMVHFAHSDLYDLQLPLLLPGLVDAVVVASDRLADRCRALPLDVPIVRVRQPIDTERFAAQGSSPSRPRRALILSNYLDGDRRKALVEAWEAAGVECVQVGHPTKSQVDVVAAIGDADIVVAKARAALEAMSCGRAVYLYDQFGADGWITPENYPALEADAFAGLAMPAPRSPSELAADLDSYSPEMGQVNRELVRRHHNARRHAATLVEVLRGPKPPRRQEATPLSEISRLTRSAWHWERRSFVTQQVLVEQRARARAAEAEAERMRLRAVEAEKKLGRARKQLASRRVRAGVRAGRWLDRLRGRP